MLKLDLSRSFPMMQSPLLKSVFPCLFLSLVAMVNQTIIAMTTQAFNSPVPHQTRKGLLRTAVQNAALCVCERECLRVCICVYVGKTQGLLEKQSNYKTVIYARAWTCLQSAALLKFVTILGRLFFNLIYIRA